MAELLSRADCIARFGSDYYTKQQIKAGKLFRIDKGAFSEKPYVPEIALLSWKYPHAVVTMLSAFYHYGLTDLIPDVCDLATHMDSAKIHDPRVHQHFLPGYFLSVGAVREEIQGFSVRIYSRERMLIELIRFKNKLPYDLYKEVLLNYRKILPQLNIQDIQDIAMSAPKHAVVMAILESEVL